ncbi:hypothetical protein AUR64_16230 [Haloprofundus marisrubri]|uniref:Uncharacterized protein n=1 Tax=Haloprofundus marisrubri TaxID=1514971 RepID=A0A0W1R7Z3_9EURY|nr:hypothetical protein [Haloprofundus marisrubri]KTG09328.1 hypothetical protein AUR64_16230 [Haloprofundus marisrubri]
MALVDSILIVFVNLLVGGLGLYLGVRLLIDKQASFGYAVVTAAIGALVWGLFSFFVGGIPIIGPILTLLAWIGVINWRYPGGWGSATAIGVVAWLAAVAVLYVLGVLGVVGLSALGIPGA